MKSKFLSTMVVATSLFTTTLIANADGGPNKPMFSDFYVRGNVAFPVYNNTADDYGFKGEDAKFMPFGLLAFGVKLDPNYSAEVEGFYRSFDFKSTINSVSQEFKLDSYGVLLNAVIHPTKMRSKKFEPFFGGGIGYGQNKSNNVSSATALAATAVSQGRETNNFLYQLFVGTDYRLNQNLSLTGDVRWMYFNKVEHRSADEQTTSSMKLGTVALTLGAKYYF